MNEKHVAGKKVGDIMLYALSTCVWCRKTKALLDEMGVEYDYLDVDLLEGAEKDSAIKAVKQHNPACSFPTMVINQQKCIVGFKEDEIRESLGK